MNCPEIQESLAAWLDEECTRDERVAIEAHLHECPACREEAEAMRSVAVAVRSAPPLEPSATWDLSLQRKLDALKTRELTEEVRSLRRIVEELAGRLRGMEEKPALAPAVDPMMTVEEVAAYLRVTSEAVHEILADLPRIEVSHYEVRFRKSSIDRWLELHEAKPANEGFQWSDWIYGSGPYLSS